MTEQDILRAYTRIRTIDHTIPDDVLDFMKNASINQLRVNSIDDILGKFENGIELYRTNVLFANCVEHLLIGGDIYKIFEQIIVIHSEQQKRYKELIESGVLRQEIVVTKERFDEIVKQSYCFSGATESKYGRCESQCQYCSKHERK